MKNITATSASIEQQTHIRLLPTILLSRLAGRTTIDLLSYFLSVAVALIVNVIINPEE